MSEAKEEDTKKRRTLSNFYTEAENCLKKMDDQIKALLPQQVVNLQERMNNHKVQLERKEYFLLVAGKW